MDQGGQERRQMDEAILPQLQGQSDASAIVRVIRSYRGLQLGEFPAALGLAP